MSKWTQNWVVRSFRSPCSSFWKTLHSVTSPLLRWRVAPCFLLAMALAIAATNFLIFSNHTSVRVLQVRLYKLQMSAQPFYTPRSLFCLDLQIGGCNSDLWPSRTQQISGAQPEGPLGSWSCLLKTFFFFPTPDCSVWLDSLAVWLRAALSQFLNWMYDGCVCSLFLSHLCFYPFCTWPKIFIANRNIIHKQQKWG